MQRAAEQMNTAPKQLHPATMQMMQSFEWRGNVRQLENVCLWLTVMATGNTVMVEDLPPELLENSDATLDNQQQYLSSQDPIENNPLQSQYASGSQSWQQALAIWAKQSLREGATDILQTATPEFERVLLTAALNHSGGKKIAAANLLGWGRNTLTRKLQQLDISSYQE
jgi:two-component system nitrogen regulation response regulator GlnG